MNTVALELFMGKELTVKILPNRKTTKEGPYYPQIDGINVGEKNRAFWPTITEAMSVAKRLVLRIENSIKDQ